MVLIRHPEHARFDRTILDAGRRPCAAGAAIGGDRKYAWPLLPRSFSVARRHWPMFFHDVEHSEYPHGSYLDPVIADCGFMSDTL